MVACIIIGLLSNHLQTLPLSLMSFEIYLLLEFLIAVTSVGSFGAGIITDIEWGTSKYHFRIKTMTSILDILIVYIIIYLIAWCFDDTFLAYRLVLNVPLWIMARHNYDKVGNDEQRPENSLIHRIVFPTMKTPDSKTNDNNTEQITICALLKLKSQSIHLIIISFVWLFLFFSYFGVVLWSTKTHHDKFVRLIIMFLSNIPCSICVWLFSKYLTRCLPISLTIFFYGLLLIVSTCILKDNRAFQITLFVVSKVVITMALMGISTFTQEFWPKASQNAAFNACRVIGRLGSIIAVLSIILIENTITLPLVPFASAAILSSIVLAMFLSEKSPDIIEPITNSNNKNAKCSCEINVYR